MAFRAVAVGVVADEPEFVGDAGGQRADLGERNGGGGRGASQFGGASGGAAEGVCHGGARIRRLEFRRIHKWSWAGELADHLDEGPRYETRWLHE